MTLPHRTRENLLVNLNQEYLTPKEIFGHTQCHFQLSHLALLSGPCGQEAECILEPPIMARQRMVLPQWPEKTQLENLGLRRGSSKCLLWSVPIQCLSFIRAPSHTYSQLLGP